MVCVEMKNNLLSVAMLIAQIELAFCAVLSIMPQYLIFGLIALILCFISIWITIYAIMKGQAFNKYNKRVNMTGFFIIFILHISSILIAIIAIHNTTKVVGI